MGAKVSWTENSVTVTGPPQDSSGRKHLRAIDVNMNKMPDVAMTLAVVALYADGPTAIRDGMFCLLVVKDGNVVIQFVFAYHKKTNYLLGKSKFPFFGPLDFSNVCSS